MLVSRPIKVLSRRSTLSWLLTANGIDGRLGRWAALLSQWSLEVIKCTKGEEEILGTLAASITPRAEVEEALIAIAPRKQPRQTIVLPPPTVGPTEELMVLSFDGSASVKKGVGAYSAILWKLPEWKAIAAASDFTPGITVNEAECRGLLLSLDLLAGRTQGRIIICGDSNLVIRQITGEIDCKAPRLRLLNDRVMSALRRWPEHELLHVKRDWNNSADHLATLAMRDQTDSPLRIQDGWTNWGR